MSIATDTSKTERISIRLEPAIKQRIEQAASIDHRSITSFIIASAAEMAEKILNKSEQLILSDQDWNTFFNALVKPHEPNKALRKAFEEYSNLNIKSDI